MSVIVTLCAADEVFVVTFPKLKLPGLIPMVKVAARPVPVRATDVGEDGALLMIETLPDATPTIVGVNAIVMVVFWPAFTLKGSVNPLTLKVDPLAVICVMVSVAVPVFVIVNGRDVRIPTTSFPKLMLFELTCTAGAGAALTVSVAALLVALPAVLLTTTSNVEPLSVVAVAGVV